ncbi:MAG: CBS domain-containing protein [Pseudomonadota bacterium]|nr:CBS domain-containing protein [Pseudomonadota bacterium]
MADWIGDHPARVVTVVPDATVEQAADQMLSQPCLRDLYVVDQSGRVVGHVSHRKLAKLLLARYHPRPTRRQILERVTGERVSHIMDMHFPCARASEDLDDVLHRLLDHDMEDMPVVDEAACLIGAINLSALLRAQRESTSASDGG